MRTRLIGRWTRSNKNRLKVESLADQSYRKSHSQTNSGKLEPESSSQPRFVAVSWGSKSLGIKIWSSLWSGPTGLCWARLGHFARIVRLLSPAFDFTGYLFIQAFWLNRLYYLSCCFTLSKWQSLRPGEQLQPGMLALPCVPVQIQLCPSICTAQYTSKIKQESIEVDVTSRFNYEEKTEARSPWPSRPVLWKDTRKKNEKKAVRVRGINW